MELRSNSKHMLFQPRIENQGEGEETQIVEGSHNIQEAMWGLPLEGTSYSEARGIDFFD